MNEIEKAERDEVTRAIAEEVLKCDDREVQTVYIEAIPGLEHADSFQRLQDRFEFEYRDEYLETSFGPDAGAVRDVLDLFSTPLIRAVFYDESGREIFARHEHSSVTFETDESNLEDIRSALTDEQRAVIQQWQEPDDS